MIFCSVLTQNFKTMLFMLNYYPYGWGSKKITLAVLKLQFLPDKTLNVGKLFNKKQTR